MSRPEPQRVSGLALSERSLAPDLARGFMLLVISVVHAVLFRTMATGEQLPYTLQSTADSVSVFVVTVLAESRGYPMFALLFGYGLAWIHLRRTEEGHTWPWVRSLVRRRGRWMILIGFLHTLLLFSGDIIAVYGLIAVAMAGLLHVGDRRLLAHGFGWLAVGSLVYTVLTAGSAMAAETEEAMPIAGDPLTDMAVRGVGWPIMLVMVPVSVLPFTVGIWAARRRLLEEPGRHRYLLTRVAGYGIPTAVLGGIPYALYVTELWQPAAPVVLGAAWLHLVTGYLGGFEYAALIALVALRIGQRRGPVVTALVATGQRSMTCYVLQSLAWLVLFMPYTLDLARMSDTAAVLTGAGVWLATVVLADLMRRAGMRGPLESLLRNRTYAGVRRTEPV
ncbi:DUF418 domain-containing protein [Nocardiopsis sp. HNM0947]|uniref:DUF418 domain-containing protein n=1 Tax=Nocardiopsis coralli TaxID=2772213 RepID=A0ABR9PAK2_9ACTN|nr:DUF418 domain-containing protein [Nocardiopsis coralli]MBE3000862.1 DUF418 domain-containing protein [Nocardiopsis coralli]